MIRHCYNCEWVLRFMGIDKCDVFYEHIHDPKKKAKRCEYFTMKEGNHVDKIIEPAGAKKQPISIDELPSPCYKPLR